MQKIATTALKGVTRKYVCVVVKKADTDLTKRAGELSEDGVEHIQVSTRSQEGS